METQKLNEMIAEINRHFVDEILGGLYEIKEWQSTGCYVVLDTGSSKQFCLWIANSHYNFETYNSGVHENFMRLTFSDEEKELLHIRFNGLYSEYQGTPEETERRRKEYEKLKAEFEGQDQPTPAT